MRPTTAGGRAANRCRSTSPSAWRRAPTAADTSASSGRGPVLPYSPDEPFVLSGPKIRRFDGHWYLWYIAGRKWKLVDGRPEPVYKIRMATSADGIALDEARTGTSSQAASKRTRRRPAPTSSSPTASTTCSSVTATAVDYRGKDERLPHWLRVEHRPRRLGPRRRQGRHRRLRGRLGLGDGQLPARVRARRADLHGLPRQPGRPTRIRACASSKATLRRRDGDEVEQARKDLRSRLDTLPNGCVAVRAVTAGARVRRLRARSTSRPARWTSTAST